MKIQWSSVLVGTVAAGCVSLSAGNPVRPPAGRSAAELTQDQARCEQHAKAQPKNRGDHYLACMIASGYTVNWDMDNIGDRKSTRLNSSHTVISYAVFCL